jgi:hypothetical protein
LLIREQLKIEAEYPQRRPERDPGGAKGGLPL